MSPTNLRLENIFSDAVIPEALSEAVLYDTKANTKERKMIITIASKKLIPYDVIEEFKKYIKEKYNLASFVLKVKYIETTLSDLGIKGYYKNLVFYVNEVVPGVRHLFLDSSAHLNGDVLTICCKYGIGLLEDMQCADTIKRLIAAQTGAAVEVEFVDESDSEEYEKVIEEALNALPEIEAPAESDTAVTAPEEDSNIIYGKEIKDEPVAISEISMDAKFVTIQGDIIYFDSREVKNEKTMAKFYLADESDALFQIKNLHR